VGTSVSVLQMLMLMWLLMSRMTASGMVDGDEVRGREYIRPRILLACAEQRTTGTGMNVPIGHGSIVIPEIVEVDDEPVLIVIQHRLGRMPIIIPWLALIVRKQCTRISITLISQVRRLGGETRLVVQELCELSDSIFEEVILQDRHGVLRLSEEVCHDHPGRRAVVLFTRCVVPFGDDGGVNV